MRLSRGFRLSGGARLEGLVEAFNLTNRVNNLTRNANFGPGAYPTNPSSDVQPDHRRRRSRTFQLGLRLTF